MADTASPVLISESEHEYAVVISQDGTVLHNAMQMDDPVIRKAYDDGMVHLFSKKTGRLILAPFNPETAERVHCPHCNGELGGNPYGGG